MFSDLRSPVLAALSALAVLALLALTPAPGAAQTTPPAGADEMPPPLPPQDPPVVEAPPPLPTFFVAIAGQPVGPLTLVEITALIREGRVTPATLVWRSGMADWAPAAEVPLVAELFDVAAAPVEPAPVDPAPVDPAPPDAGPADPAPVDPAPIDPAPDFDAAAYLVGTWRNDTPISFDDLGETEGVLTLTYAADGTMSGGGTLSAMIAGQGRVTFTLRINGNWTVEHVGDARFNLTLDSTVQFRAPTLGVNETEQGVDTALMSVIDPDTMRDGDGVIWVR